jgi:signal transduction histidine kinase
LGTRSLNWPWSCDTDPSGSVHLALTSANATVPRARALLDELQGETNAALEELRDLARGIYPPLLADEGLAAALSA